MDLYLNNQVIILTEGEKNLTDNIIQILSGEGAIAVLLGKDESLHRHRQYENTDLSKKTINEVILKYGRIDGLVNLPAVHSKYKQEEESEEDFLKVLQENLSNYFTITHNSLPYLKTSGGAVINISFEPEEFGQNSSSTYATNGGIIALTREWAVELLKYNIRVNSIINKVNTPEIGNIVAFLLSEKSSHTTGQVIRADK
ncbi:MAG TPA: SDR family oxidoreductase [Puia sp.]|jgi:L-fucose dehydrogenase|nr:SDR family oxidoreductase [Puia sp.]